MCHILLQRYHICLFLKYVRQLTLGERTFLVFDKNKGIICASCKTVKSILIENQKELLLYNKGQVKKANQQCKWLKITLNKSSEKVGWRPSILNHTRNPLVRKKQSRF